MQFDYQLGIINKSLRSRQTGHTSIKHVGYKSDLIKK